MILIFFAFVVYRCLSAKTHRMIYPPQTHLKLSEDSGNPCKSFQLIDQIRKPMLYSKFSPHYKIHGLFHQFFCNPLGLRFLSHSKEESSSFFKPFMLLLKSPSRNNSTRYAAWGWINRFKQPKTLNNPIYMDLKNA